MLLPAFDQVLFFNTVFDKLVLASTLLLIGGAVNRWLERYRANMALSTEAAKLRLAHIGKLWEDMSAWEADVKGLFIEFTSECLLALRTAGVEGTPDESVDTIEAIFAMSHRAIPVEILEPVQAVVGPKKQEHIQRGRELWREIDRQRFWLGEELFKSLKSYHLAVQKADTLLGLTPEEMNAGAQAMSDLDSARQGVDSTIAHLLSGK